MKSILVTILLSVTGFQVQADEHNSDWPKPVIDIKTGKVLFDRLEIARSNEQENRAVWDMLAWYGGDYHRLVFKSEGENTQNDGEPTDLESAELLYGYLISPFWSFQTGIGTRGELSSDTQMEHYAVIGFMGLAPYWFEMDNSLLINEKGDVQFISETEYDWQLTQTSYLQPRLELTVNLSDSEKYDRQSGFSHLRMGLRYRHEITREFAPYVGVYWDKTLGNSADALQAQGADTSETGFVLGARVWF